MTIVFIDSLCQKFPTLAQGTFDNEALKFLDIERWNLESSFFEPIISCADFF